MKLTHLIVASFLLGTSASHAAALFTYNFSDVTTSSSTSAGGAASNLTFSEFSAHGVGATATAAGVFSFTGWTTGATSGSDAFSGGIDSGDYFEFTITPNAGFQFSLTSLDFSAGRTSTGPRQFVVRSSADGFANNLAASVTSANESVVPTNVIQFSDNSSTALYSGNAISLSGASFTDVVSPLTFRIYAFNAESNGGFRIDDFAINGSVSALTAGSGSSSVPDTTPGSTLVGLLLALLIAAGRSTGARATP
jgi:hypothetical protein